MPIIRLPETKQFQGGATVSRWRKAEGDAAAKGEVLADLETETALVELVAAVEGRLTAHLAGARTSVQPGSPLGILATAGEDPAALAQAARSNSASSTSPAPQEAKPVTDSTASPAPPAGAVTPIYMPQAGNTMEEGTLLEWRIKPGDHVETGQIIAEIETDKASIEFEAPEAGRVARLTAAEGDIVAVKHVIALLAENDADADAWLAAQEDSAGATPSPSAPAPSAPAPAPSAPAPAPSAPAQAPAPEPPAPKPVAAAPSPRAVAPAPSVVTGRVKASPYAKKVAAQLGVDIARAGAGSGPQGRLVSTDIERAAARGIGAAGPAAAPIDVVPAKVVLGEPVRSTITSMRKAIAKNLQTSKQTVPHWYLKVSIDADPLLRFYKGEKPRYQLTLNDVIVFAVSRVVMEIPEFRQRLEGDELVTLANANIGVAVGTDKGLVVPVICGVDQMTLPQLGLEAKRIVDAARAGKIEGIGKAVFTISNLGMAGVEEFSAIINPPESGILAVGSARETVIVRDGALRPGRTMTMVLSSDHRVVDGMVAARFAARLKEMLENPAAM